MSERRLDRFSRGLLVLVIVVTLIVCGDLLFLRFGLAGAALTEVFLFLLPGVLYSVLSGHDLKRTFPLRRPRLVHLVAAVVLAAGMSLVASAILSWQRSFWPLPAEQEAAWARLEAEAVAAPGLALVALVVLPAIAEEALFRGLVLQRLLLRFPPALAVSLSALLFAAFHRSPHRFLPQALLGLGLGLLVARGRSLWPALVLHLGYNSAVLALGPRLNEASPGSGVVLVVIGAALAAVAGPGAEAGGVEGKSLHNPVRMETANLPVGGPETP